MARFKRNEITVSKSIDNFSEKKPRTRIQLSNEILEEFEKSDVETIEMINTVVLINLI